LSHLKNSKECLARIISKPGYNNTKIIVIMTRDKASGMFKMGVKCSKGSNLSKQHKMT